jgi:glycosyltransferase involved in cell wall biosynthesis
MRSTRPLRRSCALWIPRNARWFDVGFYAAQLARATLSTRLYEQAPRAWRAQVLHIQHTPDAIGDLELTQQVQWARENGMPVLVTEHAVADRAEAWEQHADVLVALTTRGVERLQSRWRHKRVELLPPGCPPWRQAARLQPGRTIAVIGQPTSEQGAEQLLEALRALPDAELLVFGTLPAGSGGKGWPEAVHGLPVRCLELPASDEELVRQLGDAADVVVFWHDESPYAATNYAACIAVASGVPVLSSRTSAFADLAGAIFQPEELIGGLEELFTNATLRAELASAARAHCEQASWQRAAAYHLALWRTLSLS